MELLALVNGKEVLVSSDTLAGANVVIRSIPCESSVYEGAVVRMQSNGVAKNAIADSLENSNMFGVVELKQSLNVCDVRVLGVTSDIFVGLDVTKEYFLSDSVDGGLSETIPTTSGHVILKVGQPYSDSELLILKGQRTTRL